MIIMLISIEAQREGSGFPVISMIMLTKSDHHTRSTVLVCPSHYQQNVYSQKPAAAGLYAYALRNVDMAFG